MRFRSLPAARPFAAALLAAALASLPLAAQDDPPAQQDPAAAATPDDPRIAMPLRELQLELVPKTRAELEEDVGAWQDLLRAKVAEITDLEIELMRLRQAEQPDRDPQPLQARLLALKDQRTALLDRFDAVLDAYELKGGEGEAARQYAAAVSGSIFGDLRESASGFDLAGIKDAVLHWLTSEQGGIRWLKNLAVFVGILLVFKVLSSFAGKVIDRGLRTFRRTPDLLRSFLVTITRNLVLLIGIVMAVAALEVNVTPLVAAIGGAAFVLGFALQGTLSNFASGVMILLYRPFEIGDAVSVAGVLGKVEAMTLVSTTIATFDNQEVVVPNSSIWGNVITNITAKPTRRIDMTFGISYADDIDRAAKIFEEIVTAHPKVLEEPAPLIKMHELADSSVNFIVRPWSKTADYWEIYWDVQREVKKRLDAEGISIPFPQRDVHLFQESAAVDREAESARA